MKMWLNRTGTKIVLPLAAAAALLGWMIFSAHRMSFTHLFSQEMAGSLVFSLGERGYLANLAPRVQLEAYPTYTHIASDQPDPSTINGWFTVTVWVSSPVGYPAGWVSVWAPTLSGWCTITLYGGHGSCRMRGTNGGVHTLTAYYLPNLGGIFMTSQDTEQHTVIPADTTTRILSDAPDPSKPGGLITVTFSVVSGWEVPAGTVNVYDSSGGNSCFGSLAGGMGSCRLRLMDIGYTVLNAAYSGDADHQPSQDTEPHSVKADTTTAILADLPDPSLPGQPVTVTFSVTSTMGTPNGSVEVTTSELAVGCTGSLQAGQGSCIVVFPHARDYLLTAEYTGDDGHFSSVAEDLHQVVKAETSLLLSGQPNPSLPGQPFTVTFEVTSTWSVPSGGVIVTDSAGEASCTGELEAGSGSCTLALAQPGEHTLSATYSGDDNHLGSGYLEAHLVNSFRIYLPVTER